MLWKLVVGFCIASAIAEVVLIASPRITDFGEWGQYEECPPGMFVYGFQMKVEPFQGQAWYDDTALNAIYLLCVPPAYRRDTYEFLSQDPSTRAFAKISSLEGDRGYFRAVWECPHGFFAKGFELKSAKARGWAYDDTAANNMKLLCTNGLLMEGDGEKDGNWTGLQTCPRTLLVCGIQTQVELAATDLTMLNNFTHGCYRVKQRQLGMLPAKCYTNKLIKYHVYIISFVEF
ncbi:unnamed protein product [Allacma fusca]|uniref:Uncharacterized protein n=1 Tax=Allacma fusca TaxID=39272 RepID=A0A8J2KW20_9HEXA|nr:unnamed protein product [Allacma fusca]